MRSFVGRADVRLRVGDQALCHPGKNVNRWPVTVERVVDDPRRRHPQVLRTLVYGIAPPGTRAVQVIVGTETRPVTFTRRTRAFLTVLPGSARRTDVVVEVDGRTRRREVDFGRLNMPDDGTLEEGSFRTELVVPSPIGGPPVALHSYGLATDEGSAAQGTDPPLRCFEPGRVVGTEIGALHPRFGSFAEGPFLSPADVFVNSLPPPFPAFDTESCTPNPFGPRGPLRTLGAKRFSRRLVLVHGVLSPRVARITAHGRRSRPSRPAVAPSRAFLIPVVSRGRVGEAVRLRARLQDGKRYSETIALGPPDLPTRWSTWEEGESANTIRLRWLGGATPPVTAQVRERDRRISVRILERHPPDFSPEGLRIAIPAIGISRCVAIRLRQPLENRPIFDATARRRRPRTSEEAFGGMSRPCPRIRVRRLD